MSSLVQNKPHWKDAAIERSVIITDAWETTLVYAGRFAEPILYVCMVIDIIQILPSVTLPVSITSGTLATQAISLDIAGLSLASMADNAKANGNIEAANRARITGWFLISLMILTVLFVTMGQLYGQLKPFCDASEKVLILSRVVMTIVYATVIHGLRRVTTSAPTAREVEGLHQHIERLRHDHEATIRRLETETRNERTRLEQQYENRETILKSSIMEEVTQRLLETIPVPIPAIPGNATVFMGMDATPSGIQENQEDVSNGVEPFPTIPMNVRNDIIDARKTGLAKSKICAALGWGNGKYPLVKQVLDEWERQQVTIGNASS